MKKNVFGRQFSRDTNERKSLFKSLISALILQESIKTTAEKAKAIKGDVDKLVNKAKKGNERLATQLLQRSIGIQAMEKMIKEIAPRFKDRTSGYTRIIKLGRRFSDNAAMVIMEWVVKKVETPKVETKGGVKELSARKTEEKAKKSETKITKKENTKKKAVKK